MHLDEPGLTLHLNGPRKAERRFLPRKNNTAELSGAEKKYIKKQQEVFQLDSQMRISLINF